MMKYIFLFALTITIVAALITFWLAPMLGLDVSLSSGVFPNGTAIPKDLLTCKTNSDCFAGECCHSRICINELGTPDCRNVFCTEECRSDTMDCGCGSCACVTGRCVTKFSQSEFCS